MLDFRSDTVTRPTPGMRAAIAQAVVGDDVFDDDPTVHELQAEVAAMLGKEASLFVPSGTMSNQIAVRLHCRPGDELICESQCHIYNYEQGGYAQLSGVAVRPVAGEGCILRKEQLIGLIRAENEHLARTKLVCLENTHNRGAGRVLPYDEVAAICAWAHENGLRTHLDGARLFNAVVASGIPAREWARHFDTVSVCFSKGLGAPVGSALAGPKDLLYEGRRHRKLFGGGMRQAGILAAGALYALRHHVQRLAEDHQNAQRLAEGIRAIPGLRLKPDWVETNIVIFEVEKTFGSAAQFAAALEKQGLRMIAFGPQLIRACTHLDISQADVDRAVDILARTACEFHRLGKPASIKDSAYV